MMRKRWYRRILIFMLIVVSAFGTNLCIEQYQEEFEKQQPDMVLLDIMLPVLDGWGVRIDATHVKVTDVFSVAEKAEKLLQNRVYNVNGLREKLDGVSSEWNLKTVWGVGYKFEVVS